MREIEFRGKTKNSNKWIYGNLIIKKRKLSVQTLEKELFEYKYSIQYINKNGKTTTIEVQKDTIGQYVGTGEYGRIYEGMKLYDEYAEEYCTIEYDEEDCGFRLIYDGYTERIESLAGLQIVNEDLLEKGAEE